MKKNLRVLTFVALLLVFFSGNAAALDYKDVWVTDDGSTKNYRSAAETVGEFFAEEGIEIHDKDIVNAELEGPLKQNMKIKIERAAEVSIRYGKKTYNEIVEPGTYAITVINRFTEEQGIEDYFFDGQYNEIVYSGMELEISEKSTSIITVTEIIEFETERIETEDLDLGTEEVATKGVEGRKEISTEITYVNGKETGREVIEEKIITEPENEVIHVGIGKTIPVSIVEKTQAASVNYSGGSISPDSLAYSQEFTMEATAYTAGYESTGKNPGDPGYGVTATGITAEHGIVAVDPKVIPLGTELYVEGYGYCIAADTGSAIKGNKIDLFYESLEAALQFGRRDIKVYVLN